MTPMRQGRRNDCSPSSGAGRRAPARPDRRTMPARQAGVLVWVLACAMSIGQTARADSARALVRKGNAAFAGGDFNEAMSAYEEADVEAPNSAVIEFNKGTVFYRQDDITAAREAFAKAAANAPDAAFEANARYNIGNCWFREARRQRDSDPKKALETCEKAIDSYHTALALNPDLVDARRNIEVSRMLWKSILDEQRKRQEEQRQQQELAEELKKLEQRQRQAAEQSAKLAGKKRSEGTTPEVAGHSREQAGAQQQLKQDTQEAARQMEEGARQASAPSPGSPTPPEPPGDEDPLQQALTHLEEALQAQERAVEQLEKTRPEGAEPDQKQAADALRKALESLSGQQDRQQANDQQQDEDRQQEGDEQQSDDGGREDDEQQGDDRGREDDQRQDGSRQPDQARQPDPEADQEEPDEAMMLDQDARDILDQEKINRERQRAARQRGVRPVEKDW